ncbi:phosphoribosyl-AMP cyclohydrolase [Buchnera aphidicola str. Bp (Baizongia pistaciae)]|uniref:Histidine biosynthesis bifunctional protein HisIE n=1 Tax=Buchnera aphidicola subsp. Baizongia pistaciae (strain Bp) TaxID=224915 RepID=HIS2_BUCBP|nr:bifunctional phosphoribosyl-AMP cyclohydrolase/phosphoribosyl-ATP diphosphatase HisIE [Buchnera aphidicola]Q89AX6.1 RecName: Full=Histidine biosynthesis bifunctional protein HisIE; Includes: RecName: Full=Phosphoribosyl-AMP cyclohydrolase; Short=PRA-CH; Includes: RecName: Full=Phosphoribosyl-ATP pyrophosphatase; Short=PRA-PH [Buchnera aphidicola str. Bp (Baizongia pistaciae)]AAO26835.1 phosphoribosyl-AMP cyclohydrolase [Buchnera aphidicola str. Bp (Baizongia pistaciae)]
MLKKINFIDINWNKVDNMLPVVIQHNLSGKVLMHGYMNQEALKRTQNEGIVTFYSRTKQRLWTKGETSKNFLYVTDIRLDCDQDALLIFVRPVGKTCHLNHVSCFQVPSENLFFLHDLDCMLKFKKHYGLENSYTFNLHKNGVNRIAQKVAEEAIETAISAVSKNKVELINESSDLVYHLLVLLHSYDLDLYDVIKNLKMRSNKQV